MKLRLLALTMMIFANDAFAAGDAGCGLGSLIISRNSKLFQLFAVTTNGSFGSQTLGITSGTSNCSASGLVQNEQEIRYFAEVNQADLTKEMAQGGGEKLYTLAALYGCDSQEKISFAKMTQSSFAKINSKENITSEELVNNINSSLKQNAICQSL